MFWFLKRKKKINTEEINNFNKAIKVIEDFILLEEFENAELAIQEIKSKENESFKIYIESVSEKNKKEELTRFKEKLIKLDTLKEKKDKYKLKYEQKIKLQKIKIAKQDLIQQLKANKSEWKFTESLMLLNKYLEKYHSDVNAISYVNKEKAIIHKLIEKNKQLKENEIRKNAFLEAKQLIWEIQDDIHLWNKESSTNSWFAKIKNSLHFYSNIKKKLKDKQLLNEVQLLLEQQNEKNDMLVQSKLALIHSWVTKEISSNNINGYELYGKIVWADKISWDTLWFYDTKNGYRFFIGDATGHGIRAGFIITQLTKQISNIIQSVSFEKVIFEVNNSLKQELKSGNFITSVFFNIPKKNISNLEFIGMWHEPLFLFRKKTRTVEKIIPGWLAAGIRIIKDITSIKKKELKMEDGDILISYSDGLTEARSTEWEMYTIDRVGKKLLEFAQNPTYEIQDIYEEFTKDLKKFTGGSNNYYDDVSIILLKRDTKKEIIQNQLQVEELLAKEWIVKSKKIKAVGRTLEEIRWEIERIKKENTIKNIIRSLDILYKTWEIPKLKQDAIRYIKEWYIHKKINFYLKKALESENAFKIKQKEKKVQDKYNVLFELYRKWDYETVINECSSIITKDGTL